MDREDNRRRGEFAKAADGNQPFSWDSGGQTYRAKTAGSRDGAEKAAV